ncbi:MAG: DUF86 domain-containing protein [Anaerolineales bacterium]|nr:DUF86 domain-containing protein [Anaerolineales bacterium]
MKRDDTVYLRHIRDAIEMIEDYTRELSENEFLSHAMAKDAVVREMEIIGEAANNISDEFQRAYPEIPWGKMIGIRNKIVHEYFNVNFPIVWDTVQSDLPLLKEAIEKLLCE